MDKGEHRDLRIYTHREGRDNWTQVKHMRTGADNHRQEVKLDTRPKDPDKTIKQEVKRENTRNRDYKIKQETDHGVKT